MSKYYNPIDYQMNNPLRKYCNWLLQEIAPNLNSILHCDIFSEERFDNLSKEEQRLYFSTNNPISFPFHHLLTFIAAEAYFTQFRTAWNPKPLRSHVSEMHEPDDQDIIDTETKRLWDVLNDVGRPFYITKMKRANKEVIDPICNMTKLEYEQLLDYERLSIHKAFILFRAQSSKKVSNSELIDYYKNLRKFSEDGYQIDKEKDVTENYAEKKVSHAYRLILFERDNRPDFFLRVAKYCTEHCIDPSKVDDSIFEKYLISYCGHPIVHNPYTKEKNHLNFTPVLWSPLFIDCSFKQLSGILYNYHQILAFANSIICNPYYQNKLTELNVSCQDMIEFMRYDYPVFDLYRRIDESSLDKNTLRALRVILSKLTRQPIDKRTQT